MVWLPAGPLGAQLYGGAVVAAPEAAAAVPAAAAPVPASASPALPARASATVTKPAAADLAVLAFVRADPFSSLPLMDTSARAATRPRGGYAASRPEGS